jgi:hypothetical protein
VTTSSTIQCGLVGVGGDVEEVADLIEENVFATGAADVLAQRHYAVGAVALAGLVVEYRDVLAVELEV